MDPAPRTPHRDTGAGAHTVYSCFQSRGRHEQHRKGQVSAKNRRRSSAIRGAHSIGDVHAGLRKPPLTSPSVRLRTPSHRPCDPQLSCNRLPRPRRLFMLVKTCGNKRCRRLLLGEALGSQRESPAQIDNSDNSYPNSTTMCANHILLCNGCTYRPWQPSNFAFDIDICKWRRASRGNARCLYSLHSCNHALTLTWTAVSENLSWPTPNRNKYARRRAALSSWCQLSKTMSDRGGRRVCAARIGHSRSLHERHLACLKFVFPRTT